MKIVKSIIVFSGAILIFLSILPLIVFFTELVRNPEMIEINYSVEQNGSRVLIDVKYNGTVDLHDFKIAFILKDGTDVVKELGLVEKGSHHSLYISLSETIGGSAEVSGIRLSFKIAGLYYFEVISGV